MKNFLLAQADYIRSETAFQTARNIVAAKITNCEHILTRYIASARRSHTETIQPFTVLQTRLGGYQKSVVLCRSVPLLLLHEARAARMYYDAVGIITKQTSWKRQRRGEGGTLNLLLNIGYHLLSLECENALIKAGLYLEVGFIHGNASNKPLLYDFMEPFRQPCVDRVILPLFSRKSGASVAERDKARFLKRFQEKLDASYWYKNRCEIMRRIILLDAYELKHCIREGREFFPYRHRWGNSSPCNKNRTYALTSLSVIPSEATASRRPVREKSR